VKLSQHALKHRLRSDVFLEIVRGGLLCVSLVLLIQAAGPDC
jgi:hypothetical protein